MSWRRARLRKIHWSRCASRARCCTSSQESAIGSQNAIHPGWVRVQHHVGIDIAWHVDEEGRAVGLGDEARRGHDLHHAHHLGHEDGSRQAGTVGLAGGGSRSGAEGGDGKGGGVADLSRAVSVGLKQPIEDDGGGLRQRVGGHEVDARAVVRRRGGQGQGGAGGGGCRTENMAINKNTGSL